MARAFGEVVVQDIHGNAISGVPVDLIDPATGVRILDTVFADGSSATTLTLPLTTDRYGHASFYLASGKLVIARATINGATYDDPIAVIDPSASVGALGSPVPAHTHVESDVTSLPTDLDAKSPLAHTHTEANVTNLVTDLAGKAAAAHSHAESNVTNLVTDLSGKSAVGHTHAESEVGSLTTDLAAKLNATGGMASTPTISDYENLTDQGADPATPAAGTHRLYAKAGGVYAKDSTGAVVGPLGTGGTGGATKFRYGPGFPSPVAGDAAPEAVADAATTTVSFQAKRTGGTGATVDLLKNGVSILSAPLSLTGTGWTSATFVASPNLATGDTLQATTPSITGGVTLISTSYVGTQ